ncbi:uncharacterized protein LOC132286016 [Cornus florida]|uniref:uncharacterized protein LOC132286016 n=1 Tax=Cornus florida TaxID=4283 RepID=UPI00289F4F76|nr:uncharacterized protein LOC132286016 [Cornus florida]
MQEPRKLPPEEASNLKPRKKKTSIQKASMAKMQVDSVKGVQELMQPLPTQIRLKSSKRGLKNEVSPLFQQPEKSTSDSLLDSSASGNDYRTLRRKYLLLEEESFGLGRELTEVEGEVKSLEEEKLALLDELVVLEGLIDPSESHTLGSRLP